MAKITQMMHALDAGDQLAAEALLPQVYDELRSLAAMYLAREQHAHVRQATSLVHEAYLRLISGTDGAAWNSQGHFFGAAATAIRRILVENARRRKSIKHGGASPHSPLREAIPIQYAEPTEDLLSLDDALKKLKLTNPQAEELVQLIYFSGLTLRQAAEILELPTRSADRLWSYAKAWLRHELREQDSSKIL